MSYNWEDNGNILQGYLMKKIDLHGHSTASDGTYTPTQYVKHAKNLELSAIALTDHDTTDGLSEFTKEGAKLGIETIPGIEISSLYNNSIETHILGYFIDIENKSIEKKLKGMQNSREERNKKMILKLQNFGIDISYKEWKEEAEGKIVGRPHLATLLVKKNACKDLREAFNKFIGNTGLAYIPKEKKTAAEAVAFLRENNICPVLAHPAVYNIDTTELINMLIQLKEHGLVGIEVIHSEHSTKKFNKLLELAYRFKLFPTGGSDFHGEKKQFVKMGIPEVPYSYLENLKSGWIKLKGE